MWSHRDQLCALVASLITARYILYLGRALRRNRTADILIRWSHQEPLRATPFPRSRPTMSAEVIGSL
jgi:hypothetical protein